MSNLTTEVFGDMNYLYEHIANRDAQQLNENSEHYDEETTKLVEDIFYNISYSMASEGYSANGILDFLSKASEEDILEKYFDCTISEGLVSEEYILEQFQIIDEGIPGLKLLANLGRGAVKGTLGFTKRLATAGSGAMKGGGGVRDAFGAMGKSTQRAIKQSGAVTAVKDLAKGAKTALTSPTAKKIGLGAAALGTAAGAGYIGAKVAGAGSDQGPSPTGGKSGTPGSASNADFTKGSVLAKLGGREGRIKDGEFRTMGWSQQSKDRYNKTKAATTPPPAPKLPAPTGSGSGKPAGGGSGKPSTPAKSTTSAKPKGSAEDQWAAANPKLAAAKAERDRTRGTSATTNPMMKDMTAGLPAPSSPSTSTAMTGFDLAKKGIDLSKKNTQQKQTVSSSYEYDAYELVLEYLFDYGHADTIEEAEYIMTELDESFIQSLVETYHANLLAEEVTEWVNELVNEGHDLSEYTWDDMVDHYFSEAKYGTKKGRHELGLKIAHGKDVGKKGAGFEKIVNKASKKYGKNRATKIAAAAMWKNLGK